MIELLQLARERGPCRPPEQRIAARATVLATAYAAHPERFSAGQPHPPARPGEVWINPPKLERLRKLAEPRPLAALAAMFLTT